MDKAGEGFKLNFIFIMIVFISIGMYMQGKINNFDRVYSLPKNTSIGLLSLGVATLLERLAAHVTHSLILTPFIIPIVGLSGLYWHYKLFDSPSE